MLGAAHYDKSKGAPKEAHQVLSTKIITRLQEMARALKALLDVVKLRESAGF